MIGERHDIIDADLPNVVRLPEWPKSLLIAELIGQSPAVVGHSYHLFITALAAGVAVFTQQDLSRGKYSALQEFETILQLPRMASRMPSGLPRIGSRMSSTRLRELRAAET